MSLSDLAALGSFISGLGVLISLIFLYFQLRQVSLQVRQAEKNQQASIRLARITRVCDINLAPFTEPTAIEAMWLGMWKADEISEVQLQQFLAFARASFLNAEDSFYQHSEGLLDEPAFETFVRSTRQFMQSPGYRVAWKGFRANYPSGFRDFMDKVVADLPQGATPTFSLATWRAAIAAEGVKASASAA